MFSGYSLVQGPTASVAQAPTSGAPNSNIAGGVVALAAVGLAAAAATNSQQQGTGGGGMPEASSPTPSPGGTGTSGLLHEAMCTRRWIVISSLPTAVHSLLCMLPTQTESLCPCFWLHLFWQDFWNLSAASWDSRQGSLLMESDVIEVSMCSMQKTTPLRASRRGKRKPRSGSRSGGLHRSEIVRHVSCPPE